MDKHILGHMEFGMEILLDSNFQLYTDCTWSQSYLEVFELENLKYSNIQRYISQ
jgi:hypothetical protein